MTLTSSAVSSEVYAFVFKWGSQGTGTSQFNNPHALATDSSGNVYVIDSGNNRVQKFGSDGHFITQWGGFNSPQGIAVDRTSSSGSVFVVDTGNNLVKKFTNSGTPQASGVVKALEMGSSILLTLLPSTLPGFFM